MNPEYQTVLDTIMNIIYKTCTEEDPNVQIQNLDNIKECLTKIFGKMQELETGEEYIKETKIIH